MNAPRKLLSMAALLTILGCNTALAADQAQAAAQTKDQAPIAAPAPEAEEELICRNQRVTGSRKRQRLCHTQDDWDNMRTSAGSDTRRIQAHNVPLKGEGG